MFDEKKGQGDLSPGNSPADLALHLVINPIITKAVL
jgi:hypothetical protein